MGLPKKFVESYLPSADRATIFGKIITEYNKEELLAIVSFLIRRSVNEQRERQQDFDTLSRLMTIK